MPDPADKPPDVRCRCCPCLATHPLGLCSFCYSVPVIRSRYEPKPSPQAPAPRPLRLYSPPPKRRPASRKVPCPFCGKRGVGLLCPERECRARFDKCRAEPADGGFGPSGSTFIPARRHTAGGGDRVTRSTRGLS